MSQEAPEQQVARNIELLKDHSILLEDGFQRFIARATGNIGAQQGELAEVASLASTLVRDIVIHVTSLQERIALLRSCDMAAAAQQSRQLEALIGNAVNSCKCASFQSHARMGRLARVSFAQLERKAAATEQGVMQQAEKLRASCQMLNHLKESALAMYHETGRLRSRGFLRQALLLAEQLDTQYCTRITAVAGDRRRLIGMVEDLLAERAASQVQLQQRLDDIRSCRFLSGDAQQEAAPPAPASPVVSSVPSRVQPCGSSLGMPPRMVSPMVRPAFQRPSSPPPPQRSLFALSVTPNPAGSSSQPVTKPPVRTSLFSVPSVSPPPPAAPSNTPRLEPLQARLARLSTEIGDLSSGNGGGKASSGSLFDMPSARTPQLVTVSGSSQPGAASASQQPAPMPIDMAYEAGMRNYLNRAAVPSSPFASKAMQHAPVSKPVASVASQTSPMHDDEAPAAPAQLPLHEALLLEELRRVMPNILNVQTHLPPLLRRLADEIEVCGNKAIARPLATLVPTPAASIQPVTRSATPPADMQQQDSLAAAFAAGTAAPAAAAPLKAMTASGSNGQAGLRAAIQSLQRVQETVGRKVAVEGQHFRELQSQVAGMDARLQAVEAAHKGTQASVPNMPAAWRSSAVQAGGSSSTAAAVEPTRATQTSHPLPAFGPYNIILSPPSLTRACASSQTLTASSGRATQGSQTLSLPPGSISSTTQTPLIEQSSWATQMPASREQGVMTDDLDAREIAARTQAMNQELDRLFDALRGPFEPAIEPQQPSSAPARSSCMAEDSLLPDKRRVHHWAPAEEASRAASKVPTSAPSSVTDEDHPYQPLPSSAPLASDSFMSAATSAPSSVPWDTNGVYQLMHSQLSAPGVDSDDDSHTLLPPKNTPVGNSPFATPTSSLFWGPGSTAMTAADIAGLMTAPELDTWPSFSSPQICMPWRASGGTAHAQMNMPDLLGSFNGSMPSLPPLRITPSSLLSDVRVPISPCGDGLSSCGELEASAEDAVHRFLSQQQSSGGRGSASRQASSNAATDFTVLTGASRGHTQTGPVHPAPSTPGGSSPSSGNAAAYMACANDGSLLQESFELAKSAQSAISQEHTGPIAGSHLRDAYISRSSPADPPNSPNSPSPPALLESISEDADAISDTDELALFQQRLAAQISAGSCASAAMPGPVPDFTQLPLFGREVGGSNTISPLDVPPASPGSEDWGSQGSSGWEELDAEEADHEDNIV